MSHNNRTKPTVYYSSYSRPLTKLYYQHFVTCKFLLQRGYSALLQSVRPVCACPHIYSRS